MTDKEKLIKIKKLADAMYVKMQYLTTDTSGIRKAMEEYHQFLICEYYKEEPVSEDLEEAAWQYYDRNKPLMPSKFDLHKELIDFFKAGVMWKEQNDSNLSEVLHRDSLDEMAEEYSSCTYLEEVLREGDREVLKARLKNTFKAGAKWQEKKDQSTIELAEDHAMFAGMEKMREQMMKDAVVMEAHEEYGELWGDIRKFNTEKGKKYKVIIIKQEDD